MADYIIPTPRSPILGLLADAMMGGLAYMEDPRRTQQMRGVGGLLSDTGIAQTIDRLASGEPLTKGKGFATRMKPETAVAAMTLAPEAVPIGRAAMAAARATKGLPVGASIKPFNLNEGIFKPELTMQEMLRVKDIPTVQRMQKSMDLVGEKKFKGMVEDIFKQYKPTDQDQEAMLVEAVTLDILGRANRNPDLLRGLPGLKTPAPQEEALRLAQQRAALPVSEGGLGLPAGNTPMDRARAMGFTTPAYRGTTANEVTGKARTFASENPDVANQYAGYLSQFSDDPQMLDAMMKLTPSGNVMPLLVKDAAKARARTNVPDYEMILDANQARSRFAAFDPTRKNEPDLLAGALPFTALLDEENRARLEEQLGGLLGR